MTTTANSAGMPNASPVGSDFSAPLLTRLLAITRLQWSFASEQKRREITPRYERSSSRGERG